MLSFETRTRLADVLLAIGDGERQIEIVRQILCEQLDFEPYAAFKRIDRSKKGAIDIVDILNFLADNKLYNTEENCKAFLNKYDADGDSQLTYNEFLYALLPMDNPTLRTIVTQRPNYDVAEDQFLTYDVEYSLSKVIDREISFYVSMDPKKVSLLNFRDFSYNDAFYSIARASDKIDFNNLSEFFRKLGIYPNEDEIVAILRRLDRDDDGCVTFEEFSLGLEPIDVRLQITSHKSTLSMSYTSPLKTRVYSPSRKLTSTFNRAEVQSPTCYDLDSLRKTTSLLGNSGIKRVASPLRDLATTQQNSISPSRRHVIAPVRVTSPIRGTASPARVSHSFERVTSSNQEYNKYCSILRKVGSPHRKSASVRFEQTEEIHNLSKSVHQERIDLQHEFRSTGSTMLASEGVTTPLITRKMVASDGFKSDVSPLRSSHLARSQGKSPLRQETVKRSTLQAEEANGSRMLKSSLKKRGTYSMSASCWQETKSFSGKKENSRSIKFQESEARQGLIDVLKQFIQQEKELEIGKQDLSLRPDFNLLDFFRIFDVEARGSISSSEINEGLKKFGVYASKEELYLFLRRYDKDNDGKLKFSDFTEAFTCKQLEYANILNNRTPINADLVLEIDEVFSEETKKIITKVLRMHFENEGSTEALRQRLAKRFKFNVHEGFSYLDVNEDGVVTIEEVGKILDKNDFYATQKELRLLMDRLDANKDGKITYSEFVQEMTPKSETAF